ncbi:MAG: hypothetical protein LCH96_14740 [Actinobacteria bacterium]|nr:hypothetical protein [Actinomycetota bacterium]
MLGFLKAATRLIIASGCCLFGAEDPALAVEPLDDLSSRNCLGWDAHDLGEVSLDGVACGVLQLLGVRGCFPVFLGRGGLGDECPFCTLAIGLADEEAGIEEFAAQLADVRRSKPGCCAEVVGEGCAAQVAEGVDIPASTSSGHRMPRLRVLGPVQLEAFGPLPDSSHRARLGELAALLALVPGVTPTAVDEAIWPDRPREDNQVTRHTALSRLRRWLGADEAGPFLARSSLQLRIVTDWEAFLALVGGDPARTGERSTAELAAALHLVRGVPFAGVHPRRYWWADRLRVEMCLRIAAAAREVAHRAAVSDRDLAMWAAAIGLQVMPGDEHLSGCLTHTVRLTA